MKLLLVPILVVLAAAPALAAGSLSQEEALKLAFPDASAVERQSLFLSAGELAKAKELAAVEFDDELFVRYAARRGDTRLGYAYFDAHRVRTLPETIMVVVTPDGRIARIEILAFGEPREYLPKRRWLDQFERRTLDDELSLSRAIRPITGATLSGRAIANASRKLLAVHEVVETRGEKP